MIYELMRVYGPFIAFIGVVMWVMYLEKEIKSYQKQLERLQCQVNDVAQENIFSKMQGYGSCPNYKPVESCPNYKPVDISGCTQNFKADPKNITGY